jgi:hypothetical protein
MRTIVTMGAIASFIFACGSSSTTGPTIGADGGPIGTSSGSSSSSGGTFAGSCSSLGHSYSYHYTYVSGGAQCMQGTPADSTGNVDPDAGPASVAPQNTGESCTSSLVGCSFSESCTVMDDAGNGETFTIALMVAGNGTISGTESIDVSVSVLSEMCSYSVTGTKIN